MTTITDKLYTLYENSSDGMNSIKIENNELNEILNIFKESLFFLSLNKDQLQFLDESFFDSIKGFIGNIKNKLDIKKVFEKFKIKNKDNIKKVEKFVNKVKNKMPNEEKYLKEISEKFGIERNEISNIYATILKSSAFVFSFVSIPSIIILLIVLINMKVKKIDSKTAIKKVKYEIEKVLYTKKGDDNLAGAIMVNNIIIHMIIISLVVLMATGSPFLLHFSASFFVLGIGILWSQIVEIGKKDNKIGK